MYLELVIAKLVVDDREVSLPFEELKHILKVWDGVLVIFGMLVDGAVVDAHAPFVIFMDHDNVAGKEGNAAGDDTKFD